MTISRIFMTYFSEGPVLTKPGDHLPVPNGTMCDEHPTRPAVARVQGETDRFGCEAADMCQECLDEHNEEKASTPNSGVCDWCKNYARDLTSFRDFDEGKSGPVYQVCEACRIDAGRRAAEDLGYDPLDDELEPDEDLYPDPVDEEDDD